MFESWPRAKEAARANRDFLRGRAEVEAALRLWRDRGRPTDRLIHAGVPLAEAEDLIRRFATELPEELVEFARLSGNRARRRQNVVAAAAVVFAIVAVAAIAASIVAYRAKQEAVAQRDRAERATQAMTMVVETTGNTTAELYLQLFRRHVSVDLLALVADPLIQGYSQALQRDPSNAVVRASLGSAYRYKGFEQQLERLFRQWLQKSSMRPSRDGSARRRSSRGSVASASGRSEATARSASAAIAPARPPSAS